MHSRTKILSALRLLVAGTLVSLVSTTSAGAVTSTWNFNPVPVDNTYLPNGTVFTANDLTTLTASGFSYTGGPPPAAGVSTAQALALDIQSNLGYLGVCTGTNSGGTCSEGNGSFIDNEGLDEYIQLALGSPQWALKSIGLTHNQLPQAGEQDQWYLYGSNSNFLSPTTTLLASGTSQPSPITDPFLMVASISYAVVNGNGTITIAFNDNAKNHLFQNYFIATDHGPDNDNYGLRSFAGELQTAVPEPATMTLLGVSLLGLGWLGRRRR